tara:strand:- start:243 stop:830 length:588 start_codon:yes stop_codon:yes gene_type:complete
MKLTTNLYEERYTDLNQFYWYQEAFSEEEIQKIEDIASAIEEETATAGREGSGKVIKARTSKVRWMEYDDSTAWIYQKIGMYIHRANKELWNFDWEGHSDTIQHTTYYSSEKGHYDWHVDVGNGSMSMRKMSAVLLLNDDYEGGELQIKKIGEDLQHKKGNLFIFPSYLMHRVTPVTKGTRRSLVIWVGGPHPLK